MTFLRNAFDKLVAHEFRWAGTLIKLAFWWLSAFVVLIVTAFAVYRLAGMFSTIPLVIKGACLGLAILTTLLTISMFRERRRALDAHMRFLATFEGIKPASAKERSTGIPVEKMNAIRGNALSLPGRPKDWWRCLEQSLEHYTSANGEEGWFITSPVRESLKEENVVDSFYHSAFHQSVPGILTSLGLLATFVAILLALSGVTYNASDSVHAVSGIDQLINGLSGKFVSSIVALILSVIFTLLEKKVCERQLRESYDAVIKHCGDIFPILTQTRVLLDLRLDVRRLGSKNPPTSNTPEVDAH